MPCHAYLATCAQLLAAPTVTARYAFLAYFNPIASRLETRCEMMTRFCTEMHAPSFSDCLSIARELRNVLTPR